MALVDVSVDVFESLSLEVDEVSEMGGVVESDIAVDSQMIPDLWVLRYPSIPPSFVHPAPFVRHAINVTRATNQETQPIEYVDVHSSTLKTHKMVRCDLPWRALQLARLPLSASALPEPRVSLGVPVTLVLGPPAKLLFANRASSMDQTTSRCRRTQCELSAGASFGGRWLGGDRQ